MYPYQLHPIWSYADSCFHFASYSISFPPPFFCSFSRMPIVASCVPRREHSCSPVRIETLDTRNAQFSSLPSIDELADPDGGATRSFFSLSFLSFSFSFSLSLTRPQHISNSPPGDRDHRYGDDCARTSSAGPPPHTPITRRCANATRQVPIFKFAKIRTYGPRFGPTKCRVFSLPFHSSPFFFFWKTWIAERRSVGEKCGSFFSYPVGLFFFFFLRVTNENFFLVEPLGGSRLS